MQFIMASIIWYKERDAAMDSFYSCNGPVFTDNFGGSESYVKVGAGVPGRGGVPGHCH